MYLISDPPQKILKAIIIDRGTPAGNDKVTITNKVQASQSSNRAIPIISGSRREKAGPELAQEALWEVSVLSSNHAMQSVIQRSGLYIKL